MNEEIDPLIKYLTEREKIKNKWKYTFIKGDRDMFCEIELAIYKALFDDRAQKLLEYNPDSNITEILTEDHVSIERC